MSLVDIQFLGTGDAFGTGGRFNTCFHVVGAKNSFLIDCGATSLVALRKFEINPDSIDMIFLSHLHGDHFAGVVFFLMDARYVSKRKKPLVIAGPHGVKKRTIEAMQALYPGCWDKGIDFELIFVELKIGHEQGIAGVKVHPYQAKHLLDGNDFILRFEVDGKIITYSGDTGWTAELATAAHGADLLICESYHFDEKCEFHLDYDTLVQNKGYLHTRKLILTHLGPEALARKDEMEFDVAFDGMLISV
ncbi:MBL fold metallo-hydrolase [Terasakiella sp. SH-1]|uniref:MBL fold metallo-hydrolase n=1 Tax=Terasakiella sp. SH-1 TaxID=2560057 RepID=UPI001073C5AC|nr:MBL fold metallo-hydrolase [Terasakiella sp. SH-1]